MGQLIMYNYAKRGFGAIAKNPHSHVGQIHIQHYGDFISDS